MKQWKVNDNSRIIKLQPQQPYIKPVSVHNIVGSFNKTGQTDQQIERMIYCIVNRNFQLQTNRFNSKKC